MRSHKLLFFLVVLSACLPQFASDIYTPSLLDISHSLSAGIDQAQWSLAIYMVSVALSLLIYGPISEGIGRKAPMITGLAIMTLGSIVCWLAPTIDALIWGRFIQGLGAGACAGLWRSIFRDVFSGENLSKYTSYLIIFIMFIVPAAPALGGYLQEYFGWRSSFAFMAIYSIAALAAIAFGLRETSQHHHPERLRFSFIRSTYLHLLKSPLFMGITLCTFFSYGAFFSWFVIGPVLLIDKAGITPVEFGWITFLGGGAAYALAGRINGKAVSRFGMGNMMRFGWAVMILSALFMLALYPLKGVSAWPIAAPVILFYFGSTFIWPNAFATAFNPFGKIAGYTGALYSFMQVAGAAALGGVSSYLPTENQVPLALIFLFASALSWAIYEFLERTQKLTKHS